MAPSSPIATTSRFQEEPEEVAQGRFAPGGIERGQRLGRRGVRGDLGDRAAAVDESDDRPLDRIERHRATPIGRTAPV